MARSGEKPYFNCRAFLLSDASGQYNFATLVPGHYVAGSTWRPRHIHAKVSAPGFVTIITQVYFHGDPYLGDADTACGSCKSDHPDLISYLSCADGTLFSLGSLSNATSMTPVCEGNATFPVSPPIAGSSAPVSRWPPRGPTISEGVSSQRTGSLCSLLFMGHLYF